MAQQHESSKPLENAEREISLVTSDDQKTRLVHCWCCFEMTDRKNGFSDTNPTSGVTGIFSRNVTKRPARDHYRDQTENADEKMDIVSSTSMNQR